MNQDYLRRTGRTKRMIEEANKRKGIVTIIVHNEQMKKEIMGRIVGARIITMTDADNLRGLDPRSKNLFMDNGVIDELVRIATRNWVKTVDILEKAQHDKR